MAVRVVSLENLTAQETENVSDVGGTAFQGFFRAKGT